jgi:uncharacterized membrane protein (TIGR02234 family)
MIRVAQLMLVLAAAGLWGASRLPWVQLRTFDELSPPRTANVSGALWSPALVPLAVLLLAAALAALALRGLALRVLAVLVALSSAAVGSIAITAWTVGDAGLYGARVADVPVVTLIGSSRQSWGPAITAAAAVGTLLAAVLMMRSPARAKRPNKYTPPGERPAAVAPGSSGETMSERTMWDALDEGSDPTCDSGTEGR